MPTPAQLLEPLTDPSTPDSNDAIAKAVQGFNDQAQSAGHSKIADYLWSAFNDIFEVAGRTPPEQQGRLVEFVLQLSQTTAKSEDGKALQHEDGEVWRDMPTFRWVARDLWNFDATDPSATAADRAKWESWTAFLAQLTARSSDDSPLEFSLFALWTMRDAFEDDHGGKDAQTAVRLAALWVRFAGEHLRKLAVEGHTYEQRLGIPGGRYGGREWRGFSEERWKVWGQELKAAEGKFGGDELVKEAVVRMGELVK